MPPPAAVSANAKLAVGASLLPRTVSTTRTLGSSAGGRGRGGSKSSPRSPPRSPSSPRSPRSPSQRPSPPSRQASSGSPRPGSPSFVSGSPAHPTFSGWPTQNFSPHRVNAQPQVRGPRPPANFAAALDFLDGEEEGGGGPPLCRAAARGVVEDAFLALRGGASPDSADDAGRTALFRAVGRRHPRVVEMLLEAKADANLADAFGQSPLMIAAAQWDREVATLLLAGGADVNASSLDGLNALGVAARCQNVDACRLFAKVTSHVDESARKFLEERGVGSRGSDDEGDGDEDDGDEDGDDDARRRRGAAELANTTLLFDAVAAENLPRMRTLLDAKADVNRLLALAPLDAATERGGGGGGGGAGGTGAPAQEQAPPAGVETKVDSATAAATSTGVGDPLLYLNIDRPGMVRRLLEAKADANAPSAAGLSPLYTACYLGDLAVVDLLLAAKANPAYRHPIHREWSCTAVAMATKRQDVLARLHAAGARLSTLERTFMELEFSRADRLRAQAEADRRQQQRQAGSRSSRMRRRRSSGVQAAAPPVVDE